MEEAEDDELEELSSESLSSEEDEKLDVSSLSDDESLAELSLLLLLELVALLDLLDNYMREKLTFNRMFKAFTFECYVYIYSNTEALPTSGITRFDALWIAYLLVILTYPPLSLQPEGALNLLDGI